MMCTPPSPAALNVLSCAVMSASFTALPGHHQYVHGRAARSTVGQASGSAPWPMTELANTSESDTQKTRAIRSFMKWPPAADNLPDAPAREQRNRLEAVGDRTDFWV